MLTQAVTSYVLNRKEQGLYRKRQFTDETLLNFSSSDYLSLGLDRSLQQAYQRGFAHYPVGSGGSMLVSGYHKAHHDLERAFSDALDVDACVVFSSGYSANLSIMNLLKSINAHVLLDKQVHASIYDGLALSDVKYSRYHHHNLEDLAVKLPTLPKDSVIMTESIFSMSGQITPLAQIAHMAKPYQYDVLVDEAHAFGIMGEQGLGAVVAEGLTQNDVPLRMIPFGKAYAATGAIVAGKAIWIEALLQTARPGIYSTALSPAFTYGLLETLAVIRKADERREKLAQLVNYFRNCSSSSSFTWRDSYSPIQQLQLGCPHLAMAMSSRLKEKGIICFPMRPPTVSMKDTGLRVILNYHHQIEDIDRLFRSLH